MKKFLFLLCVLFSSSITAQMVEANGLLFHTDEERPDLSSAQLPVFPYADEAAVLLEMAGKIKESRGKAFAVVIDPFCGDGKSGLPLLSHHIAQRLVGSDINPRAVEYARENAVLNHLETKSCFLMRDIEREGLLHSTAPGDTLWIANPPFALKAKGACLECMRDGGENGLALTKIFVERSLAVAEPGDVILGIGYSRIRANGSIELEEELTQLVQRYDGNVRIELLAGRKLWRGFNGKKEQDNPMPITGEFFALKADPCNQEEIQAYHLSAQSHNESGFNRLGYYVYTIRIEIK